MVKHQVEAVILAEKVVDRLTVADLPVGNKAETKAAIVAETSAVVMNQMNQEPWYQSRILVAQYATLVVTLLGICGYAVAPEMRDQIVAAVIAVGALINPLWTLYARLVAKAPMTLLGSAPSA